MFSIIIPVGPGRDARAALASLMEAGLTDDDEVILVGDGREVAVPPEFADLPGRTFQTPSPHGANAARNLGASEARNDILCFLDDDDAYLPGALEWIRKRVSRDAHSGAWSLGWRLEKGFLNGNLCRPIILHEKTIWRRNKAGGCSSMVVRKSTFDRVLGFDEKMASMQDWDLWLRLSRATRIAVVQRPLTLYSNRSTDRISRNRRARIEGLERLLRKNASHWPRRVIAFHEARLAGEKFAAREGPFSAIFRPIAPFASLFFAFRYLPSSIFHS